MIQDRTNYVRVSTFLVRLMDCTPIELRERVIEAAMRSPNQFMELFDPEAPRSLGSMVASGLANAFEPLPTWRELAESSHFSMAVKVYHDTLHVNAFRAFNRVAEYCQERGYYVPEVSNSDWQHKARCGEKINAIKEFRSVYRNVLPWTGLKDAKDAVEAFIKDEEYAS